MVSWRSSILSNIEPVSRSHAGSRIATRGQSGHKQIRLISVDLLVFAEQETRNQGSAGLVIEAGVKSSLLGNKTIGFACAIRAANTNCPYRDSTEPELDGQITNFTSKGALGFQHPVRLYLPKSKSQKFLNNIGEKVLASFPVQATIHFYNDDADSEEDEEEISSA
ncbi:hypothetical protein Q9233_008080 [Columba guinea]|nr:hypothetical protein Q9233_008080 [Columba guinea]